MIGGNYIKESNEVDLVINCRYHMMDAEKELNYFNFILNLNLEDNQYQELIKYLNKDTTRHYLVAILQDKHFADIRYQNLSNSNIDLQIKLTTLYSELSSK